MSKRTINFCYDSQSPRNVKNQSIKITQVQKGPLKINSLIDSLHNPQYEDLRLGSRQDNEQQNNQKNKDKLKIGEQTSIIVKLDKQDEKPVQSKLKQSASGDKKEIALRQSRPPLNTRLYQFEAVLQDPSQADFIEDAHVKPKAPENAQVKIKQFQEHKENPKANPNEEPIKKNETQKKADSSNQISPQKPKYTFSIVPPQQQKKSTCCNIFGWCEKPKQRTYPIRE